MDLLPDSEFLFYGTSMVICCHFVAFLVSLLRVLCTGILFLLLIPSLPVLSQNY